MPRWHDNLSILVAALCLTLASPFRSAIGQVERYPRQPMPVTVAERYPGTSRGQRYPTSLRSPQRVAQVNGPFDPNTPPGGFTSPAEGAFSANPGTFSATPGSTTPGAFSGNGFGTGSTGFASPPPNANFPSNSTGFQNIPPGSVGDGFQPWSPNRPPAFPTNTSPFVPPTTGNVAPSFGTPTPTPFGPPLTPGLNTAGSVAPGLSGYPAGNGAAFGLTRFGIPPQGFDPGYSPEVQVADLTVNVTPSTQSLSYFAGLGFNSDQGVFGRLSYDDRDFDWTAFPWRNPPVPFRGGGQRLRIEAMPGAEVQRYLISFEQPFFTWFGGRPVSFHLSGHYFERDYFDWDERRAGGKLGFGYAVNDVLALRTSLTAENVDISDPRILIPELVRARGDHERYVGGVRLIYDTRDVPFAPSSGSFLELGFDQVFGSFDYPRASMDYRRYTMLTQRPDRSGRQILGLTFQGDLTGSHTPIYDNLFGGGYTNLRGFRFRHASPKNGTVIIGGELSLTGSAEYYFPVTADDMVRGVLFTDLGTISETTSIDGDDFRLSVGGGLRVYIPALGPAPLSIDAAIPLIRGDNDRVQNLHFYVNLGF